jgi:signal transduction histidine kinase/ligand-binding sensor domain-containing protein/DNA-binding response OmpR family regulator
MLKIHTKIPKLILIFLACNTYLFSYADESTNFIHVKAEVGRQQTIATSVVEDSLGYLWLNSSLGILRFDGYDYRPYPHSEIFGKEVFPASILSLSKDSHGDIWCVSKKGSISKLMPSEKFSPQYSNISMLAEHQTLESVNIGSSRIWLGSNFGTVIGQSLADSTIIRFDIYSSSETITSIVEGKDNLIWFSTNKGRIFKGNTSTMALTELKGPFSNPFNTIILTSDKNGNLWIGTELYGLFVYDLETETYEHFYNKAKPSHFVPTNMIIRIFCDSKGIIWAGTDGGGLYQVNPKSKKVSSYTHSKTNKFSLQSNTIIGLGETNNNDIWIFTNYGNINILPSESSTFGYYSGSLSGSPTRVLSLLKCENGNLWIGTDGEGITIIDKTGKAIQQFIAKTNTANGLTGNYIQAMIEDENQNKWIGTYLNGLIHYNTKTNKFSSIKAVNKAGQVATDIRALFIDSKNRIWVGSNVGISIYSLSGKQTAFFPHNKNALKGNISEVFLEDENNQIWIGMSEGGLFLFKEGKTLENSSFIPFQLINTKNQAENSITHGASDHQGNFYFVNSYSKLFKFNTKKKKTVPIIGFSDDEIHGVAAVIAVDSSNLWVSRINGISHLNLTTGHSYFYSWKNGTLKDRFLSGSAAKDKDGVLYFGGVGGLNHFDPSQIKKTKMELRLRINQLKIVNRDAEEIIPEQLSVGIEQIKTLKLNHEQTSFSFQFSVINDHLDPNYFYAYRLNGFDKDWITTENTRVATYTNIPYGNYTFEVKAGTKRNIWDIQTQTIELKILPPFWLRWWAYLIYTILFIIISFFIIRYSVMWARLKKKLFLKELQNEKNKELYELKMNFFAKMSHEIQTPLTLILSPIENMIERAEGNLLLRQRLQVIKNNANRLSRIAMELMTVRNKELGKLRISVSENNIIKDINKTALSFMEHARFKQIDFSVEGIEKEEILLWYDRQKLEHVIYNLLANAFKFTPREGKIIIALNENIEEGKVEIKITDTGIGIPSNELTNIFNLFYQSKDGKAIGGTGIGLALSQELILLHKGEITVESELHKGTTFTISIPTGNQHFSQEEFAYHESNKEEINENPILPSNLNEELKELIPDENKKNILIVEDNYEMLLFLEDSFKIFYNVRVAQNGQEAMDCLSDYKADIILSDVMMPIMDGITLCKNLKDKKCTRHIPIILLTTKNTTSSKLEGLKFGAIEYINKPFNVKELLFKVNNILDAQKRVIEQYRAEILTDCKKLEVESPDEKFIESVLLEMEKNFEDPEFRLEELAVSLNMSYSNIYRKFQSLTDKTLVDFMRSFRLQKTVPLLVNHNFTVSEIAFRVGFNDPKYFSKCFKKEYGKTPKQYKLEHESKRATSNLITKDSIN